MKWPQYGSQQKLVMILIMILLCLQQFPVLFIINYKQHSQLNSMDHSLDIRPINKHKSQSNDSHSSLVKEFREVDFGKDPQNLQDEYLDVYEGIQSDIVSSNRFNENSDISTTYLG